MDPEDEACFSDYAQGFLLRKGLLGKRQSMEKLAPNLDILHTFD
jgi:hypothetical protein